MAVIIDKASWLSIAPLLQAEGFTFWDTPNFPEFVPQDTDQFITIDSKYIGRLDLVAYDFYGSPHYWWVIALVNGLDQIPTDMVAGAKLRIPAKAYVDSVISRGPQ